MVKNKLANVYASLVKNKKDQHEDPDYDSGDAMWDDCYSDVVDSSIIKNTLDIQEGDLFRFIDFIVLDNRYWEKLLWYLLQAEWMFVENPVQKSFGDVAQIEQNSNIWRIQQIHILQL